MHRCPCAHVHVLHAHTASFSNSVGRLLGCITRPSSQNPFRPQHADLRIRTPKAYIRVLHKPSVAHCCIGVGNVLHEFINNMQTSCSPKVAQTDGDWQTLLDERQCPIAADGPGVPSTWPCTATNISDGGDAASVSPAVLIDFVNLLAAVFSSQEEELVVATVLLEKLVRTGHVCMRAHTVRVVMLTLLLVAHKVVHDDTVMLGDFCRAATPYFPLLSQQRMHALELGALQALGWTLPTVVHYQLYTNELFRLADVYRRGRGERMQPGGTPVPDILNGFLGS